MEKFYGEILLGKARAYSTLNLKRPLNGGEYDEFKRIMEEFIRDYNLAVKDNLRLTNKLERVNKILEDI